MKTGVLLETENGSIKEINFGLLTAARTGEDLVAFSPEALSDTAKEAAARYGVTALVILSAQNQDPARSPDLFAKVLAAAREEYALDGLAGLATATGRDVFARLAADLDQNLASDLLEVDLNAGTGVKSFFSGKVTAGIRIDGNPILVTLRPNAVAPVPSPAGLTVEHFAPALSHESRVRRTGLETAAQDKIELTEASVIITGGRPIGKPENYEMLEDCARVLNGAVGASRAAVDAGLAPHSMQVGQTGKTVSPNLYIACGVSGAVQHFAGMKTSRVIVGINTDKDAPIFEKCDFGIVGDMFEVVPVLTEVLKQRTQK